MCTVFSTSSLFFLFYYSLPSSNQPSPLHPEPTLTSSVLSVISLIQASGIPTSIDYARTQLPRLTKSKLSPSRLSVFLIQLFSSPSTLPQFSHNFFLRHKTQYFCSLDFSHPSPQFHFIRTLRLHINSWPSLGINGLQKPPEERSKPLCLKKNQKLHQKVQTLITLHSSTFFHLYYNVFGTTQPFRSY